MDYDFIKICGARENNLRDINLDLPKYKFVVISGVSGSGKSSLAYGTICAEGQRRYMESLSAYARQFLQIQSKPDVDSISGLSPTIAINQKSVSKNPRSNLATITEIYDYLRLLYARTGTPYSPATGKPIQSYTVSQIVDSIFSLQEGSKIYILAPVVYGKKGEHKKLLDGLISKGYSRFKIDGSIYLAEQLPGLDPNKVHEIFVVVDRLKVHESIGSRLTESVGTALALGSGVMHVEVLEEEESSFMVFSENFSCPESGFALAEIEPRIFSFNSPYGACDACDGLGCTKRLDPSLLVPDRSKSIVDGAVAPLTKMNRDVKDDFMNMISVIASYYQVNVSLPWCALPEEFRNIVLYGSPNTIPVKVLSRKVNRCVMKRFDGAISLMNSALSRCERDSYSAMQACERCSGFRLRRESLCVKINGKHIGEVLDLIVNQAIGWFSALPSSLNPKQAAIAQKITKEIVLRLKCLEGLGLGYLKLNRVSSTLSGGESQRIRLASQIGSGLTGVTYVLDEPSIGLHQRDNDMLLSMLVNLRDLGNTLVVVEHDEDTIMSADWIVEIGPGAGECGGELIFSGPPKDLLEVKDSLTGDYLSGRKSISIGEKRGYDKVISLKGASSNNLKNVDVDFPLRVMTCVTGVSGGGKSSLVMHSLYRAVKDSLDGEMKFRDDLVSIKGIEHIDKVISITQSPIGRTPLSNPATYTSVFNHIRDWYALLPESKARAYKAGRYSFNVKGGRCEACSGGGVIKIEMHFLPDMYVECDVCKGYRYNRETLEVHYKGKNISDVLSMTVLQALELFESLPLLKEKLQCLKDVGLGYIRLGQNSTMLSGGEAQRVKLAKELSRKDSGRTLYILDEPTTGLHMDDIKKLLKVLNKLVDRGNTVVVIEHNMHVIKTADYIIDIGPESGDQGGEVVATGSPWDVMKSDRSITGKYLSKYLENN